MDADVKAEGANPGVIRFDDFELDTSMFELRKSGTRIPVEPQVFDLLVFLARNHARTITKEEIFATIWGNRIVSDAALSSQIHAARRALGDDGASQRMIATVHGRGFRFARPVEGFAGTDVADDPSVLATVTARPSVAILPFTNQNRDPQEDYFADGVSEDIITSVSKHRSLTVVARNPSFAFRNSTDGIKTIGEKLNAQYIVTGSVRKAGSRIRITVQLIDAATEYGLWSERFDRDMADIFELQDEISGLVAARIEAELGLEEQRKALKRPRKNLGAWDLYQLGSAEFYRFTQASNRRSQELLRQSIAADPEFAGAHSRLAYAIVLGMVYFDAEPERGPLDEALALAKRAIELDDQDANGYFTIGRVHLARREYELAIEALQHALQLNACLAVSYCGLGDSLAYEGRLDEAIEQFEKAITLSPHDPFRWAFYSYRSLAHLFRGDFEEAALWARSAVRVPNAQYWAKAHLVAALGHLGNKEQAASAIQDLRATKPGFSLDFARKHMFYLKRADQLEIYLDGLRKAGMT
jgi:TolB-like protein/Tfp pilus assembly protein PilF